MIIPNSAPAMPRPATARMVRDYFTRAEASAIHRVPPSYLAARLGIDERTALGLLAEAMLGGTVELNWEIRCPTCNAHGPYSLGHARHAETCPACSAHFEVGLDHEIEVTFSAHPSLRPDRPAAPASDGAFAAFPPTSGHELLTVQAFRDWAQGEALPPGESLKVGHAAILFTDLAGSTALYARRGDPRAFGLVRAHFDALFSAIGGAGGAVVKTIGDSVMGAFTNAERALRAAILAHAAIAEFNRLNGLDGDEVLLLKAGLHAGPCIGVTLNGRLDYFGTTVNIAARIKDLARPGQVVLTGAMRGPRSDAMLAGRRVERTIAQVRGLEGDMEIFTCAP